MVANVGTLTLYTCPVQPLDSSCFVWAARLPKASLLKELMLFPLLINTRHLETLIDHPHNDIYHMTHQIDTSIILEFGGLKKNYGNWQSAD